MTCQLNFSPSPHDPHKDPTRSAPTKDELKQPQKEVGRPLLGPIGPNFLQETPITFPTLILDGTTSETYLRMHI